METDLAQDTPISLRFAKTAVSVEKYLLPWVYAFLAVQRILAIRLQYLNFHSPARLHAIAITTPGMFYASLTKDALLFVIAAFTCLMLLLSRPPTSLPTKLKHILTPLAMSFYFLLYLSFNYFPPDMRENLFPANWHIPLAIMAVTLSLIGYSISIWALLYLRRSFSILVSVREVVSGGPYAYVRHPIYLGYAIDLFGLMLATGSIAILFLGCGFLFLMVQRARMEEEKLCEASESYRSYVEQTRFLLPKIRGAASS